MRRFFQQIMIDKDVLLEADPSTVYGQNAVARIAFLFRFEHKTPKIGLNNQNIK